MPDFDIFTNNAATTLSSAITTTPTAGTTEVWTVVSTAAPLPQLIGGGQQYTATVGLATETDREIVDVLSLSDDGVSLSVARGAEGSTVKTHASGDPFTHVVTAAFLNELLNGLPTIQFSSAVGTTGPFNLNKTGYFANAITDIISVPFWPYPPGAIINAVNVTISHIPPSSDDFDFSVTVIVSSLDGTNTMFLYANANVAAYTSSTEVLLSDLSPGEGSGSDLTWDSGIGVSTTAGGVYSVTVSVTAGWD